MGTLVYNSYVLSSILGPPLWQIMTCAQGPQMAKSGPAEMRCSLNEIKVNLQNFGWLSYFVR